jgi:hypothetical protein
MHAIHRESDGSYEFSDRAEGAGYFQNPLCGAIKHGLQRVAL